MSCGVDLLVQYDIQNLEPLGDEDKYPHPGYFCIPF